MGFIVKAVKSVVKTVVGIASKVVGGLFGFIVGGNKTKKAKTPNTLQKSLDPEAFKKIILGRTAAPLDTRYWEVYGPKGERFVEIIAFACHRVNAILETYFEKDLAFNAVGVAQGIYAGGVVSRTTRLGVYGQTGFAVGGGTQWTAAATMDGCAYAAFDWLPDEKKLPNGIPSRITQIVEGACVYDPRRDSTVPGGSGTHRINDRTTWAYATLDGNGQPIGRNNALQALWYILGWTVPIKDAGGATIGEMLVCGRGVLPEDINLASFIAGANACEVAGYYTDVTLSTEDDHTANEDAITCDGLIGRLIDPGGLWSYYANVNDTASIAVELTDADVIEGVALNWDEFKGMSEQFNQVRGKFINPSATVLFQPFPYPMVRDATYEANLGIKRAKTQDFRQILDSTLAQRLARLLLNQGQYQGELSAGFNYKAVRAQAWSVVRYTSERFGWVKLFRVWRHEISTNSGVQMLLREIDASIWGAGTVNPPLAPGAGLKYDPRQEIAATGVVVSLVPMVGANGDQADGFRIAWDVPPTNVRRTEIRYRLVGATYWKTAGPVERDITNVQIGPELSGAIYEVAVRHISIHEIPGHWVIPTTAPANGLGQFQMGTTGTINYAAIAAAGGTAVWNNITGTGKPSDNAGTTINLIKYTGASGDVTIKGNEIEYTTPGSFYAGGYGKDDVIGTAAISARLANMPAGSIAFFGLVQAANSAWLTDPNYTFDWGFVFYADGHTYGALAGSLGTSLGAWNVNNRYGFTYDGVNAKWWINGAVVKTVAVAADLVVRPKFGVYGVGTKLADCQALPYTQNNWSAIAGIGRPEDNADLKKEITGDAVVNIFADYLGVPKSGEISKNIAYKLWRGKGQGQITSGITWAGTLLTGNVTFTVAGAGTLTFTITGPNTASLNKESTVRLTASVNAEVVATFDLKVMRIDDPPPIGTTGGSSNPGTTVNTSYFTGITSTSYTQIASLICKAGNAGSIRATLPGSYKRTPGSASGETGVNLKARWRSIGGSFTDIGSQAYGSTARTEANAGDPTINFAGSCPLDVTKTGLTTGTEYEISIEAQKVDVAGTANNAYISSGTFTAAGT